MTDVPNTLTEAHARSTDGDRYDPPSAATSPAPAVIWMLDRRGEARAPLGALVELQGYEVRAFETRKGLVRALDPARVGCIFCNTEVPHEGLDLLRDLQARGYRTPVVVASADRQLASTVALMRAGAYEVIEKPFDASIGRTLELAIRQDRRYQAEAKRTFEYRARYGALTKREREVLHLIAGGMSTRAIAEKLALSGHTVDVYRARIKHKMQTRNAADLVRVVHLLEAPGV
jgi:FixJ family two-component response regulator